MFAFRPIMISLISNLGKNKAGKTNNHERLMYVFFPTKMYYLLTIINS